MISLLNRRKKQSKNRRRMKKKLSKLKMIYLKLNLKLMHYQNIKVIMNIYIQDSEQYKKADEDLKQAKE